MADAVLKEKVEEKVQKNMSVSRVSPEHPVGQAELRQKGDTRKTDSVTKPLKEESKVEKKTQALGKKPKKTIFASKWVGFTILAVANVAILVSLIFLQGQLLKRADELKKVRAEDLGLAQGSEVEVVSTDLAANKEIKEELSSLFPDESGLVNFVREMERLKTEGVVTSFSVASQDAVRDKTGHFGIPVIIEFRGSWAQIDNDLQRLQSLPYFIRAVKLETRPDETESGVINLRYGVFIYVDESLGKN